MGRRAAPLLRSPRPWLLHDRAPGDVRVDLVETLGVLVAVDVVGPHHQRVLVRLDVVVLADATGPEAELAIELLSRLVADPDLEGEARGAPSDGLPGQSEQEAGGDLVLVPRRVDGDGGDVSVVDGHHQARVAGNDALDARHVV